jgi:hypothetical protein
LVDVAVTVGRGRVRPLTVPVESAHVSRFGWRGETSPTPRRR